MKEELQSLLCLKINVEYKKFKKRQLSMSAEEIYSNAFQIHSHMCLYENLLEMSQQLSENVLVSLITFPELMAFLYDQWLKVEDSSEEELNYYLQSEISKIHDELFLREGGLVA